MEIKKTCESQENTQQESGLQTVTAKLVSIYEYTRKGATIVTVKTDKGIFSNFKNVFQQQMLDVDALKEGDELEITYVTADIGEGHFRNYKKLKSLSHTSKSWSGQQDRLSALEKDIAEIKIEIEYLRDRASRFDLHLLRDLYQSGQLELDVDKI